MNEVGRRVIAGIAWYFTGVRPRDDRGRPPGMDWDRDVDRPGHRSPAERGVERRATAPMLVPPAPEIFVILKSLSSHGKERESTAGFGPACSSERDVP